MSAGSTFTSILSIIVILLALAGLVVAILNLRDETASCSVRALSVAYIVFFIIATFALIGSGGALLSAPGVGGAVAGAAAGLTILSFAGFAMFIIAAILAFSGRSLSDVNLRRANMIVFGGFAILSLLNLIVLFSQRRNIVESQPAREVFNFVNQRAVGSAIAGLERRVPQSTNYAAVARV